MPGCWGRSSLALAPRPRNASVPPWSPRTLGVTDPIGLGKILHRFFVCIKLIRAGRGPAQQQEEAEVASLKEMPEVVDHDGVLVAAQEQEDGTRQKAVDEDRNLLFTDDEDVLDTTEENVSSSDEEHNNSTGAGARRPPRSTSSPSSSLLSTPRVVSKNRDDEEEDEEDEDDEQLHLHDLEGSSKNEELQEAEDLQEELDRQRNVNQTVQLHRKKTVNLHTFAEDLQQHEDGILATFVFSDALDQLAGEMLLQQEEEPVKNLKSSASSDQQEPQPALLRSIATAGWKWLCDNFYGRSGAAGTRSRSSSAPDEEAPNHLLHDFVLSSEKTRRGLELLFGIVGEGDEEGEQTQNQNASSSYQESGERRKNQPNQVELIRAGRGPAQQRRSRFYKKEQVLVGQQQQQQATPSCKVEMKKDNYKMKSSMLHLLDERRAWS
ncbi:unnamed protein product [Amoebophrya sp. A120]|nr:unnamed protein product [Amoebophrya sp. A120]|eukprot:GSA120T00023714001.1